MNVNFLLFYIIVGDAVVAMLLGAIAAVLTLLNVKADTFFERVPPAAAVLVLSSFAGCALLWVAGYLFGA